MSLEEIKKYIKWYLMEVGYDDYAITDDDLKDALLDGYSIYTEDISSLRWYDVIEVVVKIKDKYFKYKWYHITGDNSPKDMGLEFDWDTVSEVEPYEVTVTKYRTVK